LTGNRLSTARHGRTCTEPSAPLRRSNNEQGVRSRNSWIAAGGTKLPPQPHRLPVHARRFHSRVDCLCAQPLGGCVNSLRRASKRSFCLTTRPCSTRRTHATMSCFVLLQHWPEHRHSDGRTSRHFVSRLASRTLCPRRQRLQLHRFSVLASARTVIDKQCVTCHSEQMKTCPPHTGVCSAP
jgi:hypothetical protein